MIHFYTYTQNFLSLFWVYLASWLLLPYLEEVIFWRFFIKLEFYLSQQWLKTLFGFWSEFTHVL